MMTVLVTGGAGYIGSHTCVELLNAGHQVVVFDNFCNSQPEVLQRVSRITGKEMALVQADIRDEDALRFALRQHNCHAVIHFAGLKDVGLSMSHPLDYCANNVGGSVALLRAMQVENVKSLVFSSSAAVYGEPKALPLTEDHPLTPTSPYGRTKLVVENVLRDLYQSDPTWRIAVLRYFNPAGAHASGLIGESPRHLASSLMSIIAQVAMCQRARLEVFGNDYPTRDGSCIRDYIHVMDLAIGHIHALSHLTEPRFLCANLGAGTGYSVLELVGHFERISRQPVPFSVAPRRAGDITASFADPTHAESQMGWRAKYDIAAICRDQWRWQQHNPAGYRSNSQEVISDL